MINDRILFGPQTELCVSSSRHLRMHYLRDLMTAAARSRRFRRAAAAGGVAVLSLVGLASFGPSRPAATWTSGSVSPTELTIALKHLPTTGMIDTH
jgi:hypothetical protein